MSMVKIELEGERRAGLRFEQFPEELRADLRKEIDALTNELRNRIATAMPKDSGKLRGTLRAVRYDDPDRVTGYISVARGDANQSRKAAALEYGSSGKPQKVKEHKRKLNHVWEEKLKRPITVMVEAFDRKPNIKAQRFLRGPMDQMRPKIMSRLEGVVSKAASDASD